METTTESDGAAAGGRGAEPSPLVEGPVADATAAIIDDHGDIKGFAVAAVALDSGYTVTQVVVNPSIDADGTLSGITPGGPPLGLLASPEPQGLRAVGAAPPEEREFALFEMTLLEIHETGARALAKRVVDEREFQEQLEAEDRARAEAQLEGAKVLSVVFLLLAQGYSFEQAIEAIILDDFEVGGGGCARRPEPPAGPEIEAISAGCTIADKNDAIDDSTTTTAQLSETDSVPAAPDEPVGPVSWSGSATMGAIASGPDDDLISADFAATVDAGIVTMDVTLVAHYWVRGGPEKVYVDQNCGATYEHVLHFEGPAGNPTSLQPVVRASQVVEVQGVLCDSDDAERWLVEVGESAGRFSGQVNELGVDGTLDFNFRSIDISAN